MRQEISRLEQLIDQLLAGIQEIIQSGEILTDEFQGAIADELQWITGRIDELRSQEGEQQPQRPIQNIPNPPSNDSQLLWHLAGQQEQAFISYLREFPSQETQALLANPALLSSTIDRLSQMYPMGQPQTIDGIQHAELNSSTIWGTSYNPKTGKMRVRFQGGSEYEYDDVPSNIYRAFQKGNAPAKTRGKNKYGEWWPSKLPSLGAAMNQYIKSGGFNYRKLK